MSTVRSVRGIWTVEIRNNQYDITASQGQSLCVELLISDSDGDIFNIKDYAVRGYLKQNYSDSTPIKILNVYKMCCSSSSESSSSVSIGVVGTACNAATVTKVAVYLSQTETETLPTNEYVYGIEAVTAGGVIIKLLRGYFLVLPETTDVFSGIITVGQEEASSSSSMGSSSSSSSLVYVPDFIAYKADNPDNSDEYIFIAEVPTDEALSRGIEYWQIILEVNGGTGLNEFSEFETVYNSQSANRVPLGYQMIYPVGGGTYRFIDKESYVSFGQIKTVFDIPVHKSLFVKGRVFLKAFTSYGQFGFISKPID